MTSTTSQGDITVELVPYGGETSDLKKLTLVISGGNKTKKDIKRPEQEISETKKRDGEDIPRKKSCKRKHLEEGNSADLEGDQEGVAGPSKKTKEEEAQKEKSGRKKIPNKKYTDPEWSYLVDLSIEDGGRIDKGLGRNETDQDKKRTEREDDKPP